MSSELQAGKAHLLDSGNTLNEEIVQSEFVETKLDWKKLTLRDAGIQLIDCDHRTPTAQATGFPYIAIPQLKDGHVRLDGNERRISSTDFNEWTKKLKPREHDVIVVRRCNSGDSAVVPPNVEWAIGQNLVVLRSIGRVVHPPFLRWLVRGEEWWEQVRKFINVGAVFDSLKCKEIPLFELTIPPFQSQIEIAGLLTSIDDRIALLRETNATLEAMAQALFKSWFVDFDPVHANAGTRAATLPAELQALFPSTFTDTPQGPVPEGWRVACLGDICQIASGKRPEVRSDLESGGAKVPLYGGAGIMGYTDKPLFDEKKILTGRVGTLGKVHIATPPFWASDNVLVLTPRNKSNFYFSLNWLLSIDVKALNRGSTQPLLTQKDLGAQQRVLPSNEILAEFESMVCELYLKIHANTQQTQTLATLRDTLLPRLISGQLRLPDAAAALAEVGA